MSSVEVSISPDYVLIKRDDLQKVLLWLNPEIEKSVVDNDALDLILAAVQNSIDKAKSDAEV